jgi:anaerobic selenocysteine-containing dehydrogenase
VVVDPRFNRSAAVADQYAPIRPGSDVAFLSGVVNYLLANDKIQHQYVREFTNASLIVREDYRFDDGLFSGYDDATRQYDRSSWTYELGDDGQVKRDETLRHPRCVFNLLKTHVSRYTPEMVETVCGTPRGEFLRVAQTLAETAATNKTASILYALGWTHHTNGAQIIRTAAIIQLLVDIAHFQQEFT